MAEEGTGEYRFCSAGTTAESGSANDTLGCDGRHTEAVGGAACNCFSGAHESIWLSTPWKTTTVRATLTERERERKEETRG